MKPLRIFRHISNEGPGYLTDFLDRHHVPYQLVCIDQGDCVPEGLEDIAGLVFMGGSMSVNDDLPWIAQELSLIRRAAALQMPVLGHCLGGQLISKALGGEVTASPIKEIGWHPVQRSETPLAEAWLGGLPNEFEVFHWHGETFSIPAGAMPILTGLACANQGFVTGNMLALQGHIEMTAAMVQDWIAHGQDELCQAAPGVQNPTLMMQDLQQRVTRLHGVADVLYSRWLQAVLAANG